MQVGLVGLVELVGRVALAAEMVASADQAAGLVEDWVARGVALPEVRAVRVAGWGSGYSEAQTPAAHERLSPQSPSRTHPCRR